MSAECQKHGTDIVYPPGTWPVGVCPECEHEDEGARLHALLDAAREALRETLDALLEATEHITEDLQPEFARLAEGERLSWPSEWRDSEYDIQTAARSMRDVAEADRGCAHG